MNEIVGSNIVRIDQCESSNNYAATQLLTKRLNEGIVFVAGSQVGGRGQGASTWESEANCNLTFSVVLYPEFVEISRQFILSKAISLGLTDFLRPLVPEVTIKWPNDIYIAKKKVAGILIENSIRRSIFSSCIIGIGLNMNQLLFLSDAPNPVSVRQVTGEVYDLKASLAALCHCLDARYGQLREGKFSQLDAEYAQMLYQRECWSDYSDVNGDFVGRIIGVARTGHLKIETRTGKINQYDFKEVVFR